MIKPEHVALALEKLKESVGKRRPDVDEAADILFGFRPFSKMDDDELLPIAEAALKALASAPPPPAAPEQPRVRRSPRQQGPQEDLLTAPYRFVEIPDQVVLAPAAAKDASYDFPLAGGFSGTLGVTWAVETPVAVGQAEGNSEIAGPARLGDRYVLPGPTLRGIVRAAMSIVTRARLTQINGKHTYGVRDFNHPLFVGEDGRSQRLAWSSLGAGWLRRQDASLEERRKGLSDYVLTPCDKKLIRIRALPPKSFNSGRPTDDGAFHLDWLKNTSLYERYRRAGYASKPAGSGERFDFESSDSTSFVRDPAAPKDDLAVADYVVPGAGGRNGWFVFAAASPLKNGITPKDLDDQQRRGGKDNAKKLECVFMDRPGAQAVRLLQSTIDRFELINSRPGKSEPEPEGSYGTLKPTLRDGRRIPVFHAGELGENGKDIDLGLTRLFKIPHANSVRNVRDRQRFHIPNPEEPDMIEALFGHVYEPGDLQLEKAASIAPDELARKGRLAFGFATLDGDVRVARALPVASTVASAPRASFAPFYLKGPVKDWTDKGERVGEARLAGRKRYFARYPQAALAGAGGLIDIELKRRFDNGTKEMESRIRFLRAAEPGGELRFTGEIRLHNLLPEEIGALLWTLTHGGDPDKPYRHMIGRARNAGAGQTRVKRLDLRLDAHPGEGSNAGLLQPPAAWERQGEGWLAEGSRSMAPFLQAFEAHMRRAAGGGSWPEGAREIQEFLGVSDPRAGEALPAAFIPTPNAHGKLRGTVKADTRFQDPTKPEPLLTTPRRDAKHIRLPYRG